MFTNISWGNYTVVVVLLGASWYLFVGLRYYFAEIKAIAKGSRKLKFRKAPEFPPILESPESPDPNSSQFYLTTADQTYQEIDSLVERLKNVVMDASQRKLQQQEFVDYLRLVLSEYSTVKNSPFRSSVSELIVSECDKLESIHLTQEEAEGLWNQKK